MDNVLFIIVFAGLSFVVLTGIRAIWKGFAKLTSDEVARLKGIKNKRDQGLITQSEYEHLVAEVKKDHNFKKDES